MTDQPPIETYEAGLELIAYRGEPPASSLPRRKPCPACLGVGRTNETINGRTIRIVCETCKGAGTVEI
jgi:DnaJ-class molecular chaperone